MKSKSLKKHHNLMLQLEKMKNQVLSIDEIIDSPIFLPHYEFVGFEKNEQYFESVNSKIKNLPES